MIRIHKNFFFPFLLLFLLVFGFIVSKFAISFAQEQQCFVSLGGNIATNSATSFCYFHFAHLSDTDNNSPKISSINTVYYCQGNVDWKNTCDIGYYGCGPTSTAMVLSSFGVAETPVDVAQDYAKLGFRECGRDASDEIYALNSQWFTDLGFEHGPNIAANGKMDLKQLQEFIDAGWLIIASSDKYPCYSTLCSTSDIKINHIVVIDGVDIVNDKVHVRDPNNCSFTDHNDENQNNIFQDASTIPWIYAYPVKKI